MNYPNVILFAFASATLASAAASPDRWTAAEIEVLRSLSIAELGPVPADPSNRVADAPDAAELGRRFFFDPRFSSNGLVSCATCHLPERDFQDSRALSIGVGTTNRRAMPIAGTAHSPFLFWDGRKDSQWAQALGPLESPVEHGGTRAQYAHVVAEEYRAEYEMIFGALPDLRAIPRVAGPVPDTPAAAWNALNADQRDHVTAVFVNIGKAIAAYERRLEPPGSRFDDYVAALILTGRAPAATLTRDEVSGLRLFIGKASCVQCHNGPLLTNYDFHNTGIPARAALPADRGRSDGARQVLADEFNRRSKWSDAPGRTSELEFVEVGATVHERSFKVPSLRNVAERAPYMHAGQMDTLRDVLRHYNRAPAAPSGHTELKPLKLGDRELNQIEAFLRTLTGRMGPQSNGNSELSARPSGQAEAATSTKVQS